MEGLGFVACVVIVIICVSFLRKDNKANAEAKQNTIIAKESNNTGLLQNLSEAINKLPIKTNIIKYLYEDTAFAISPSDDKFIIVHGDGNAGDNKKILNFRKYIYDFDNIIGIEIDINGNNVSTPSVGGAIAGGILFGGAGAIIGASNTTSIKKIQSISLKLYLDDLSNPYHELNVFKSSYFMVQKISGVNPAWEGLYPEDPVVKEALNTVNEWYGRFKAILDKKVSHTVKIPQNKTTAVRDNRSNDFEEKWDTLTKYDEGTKNAVKVLNIYGSEAIDELKKVLHATNDHRQLPIVAVQIANDYKIKIELINQKHAEREAREIQNNIEAEKRRLAEQAAQEIQDLKNAEAKTIQDKIDAEEKEIQEMPVFSTITSSKVKEKLARAIYNGFKVNSEIKYCTGCGEAMSFPDMCCTECNSTLSIATNERLVLQKVEKYLQWHNQKNNQTPSEGT